MAVLEDQVAIDQGKKQIYGSKVLVDKETQLFYVSPLEDPDNVDKRRAANGLEPLSYYLMNWNITWNVEQYKKDLPKIELMEKGGQ